MLQVILFILKLIGWILLAILGLLILVLLAVIFTPLRYQAEASCPGKLSELEAGVSFGIFFRLISGRLQYRKGNLSWNIRAAWIKLGDTGDAEEEIEEAADGLEEIGEKVLEEVADAEEASEEVRLEKAKEEASEEVRSEKAEEEASEEPKSEPPEEETAEDIKTENLPQGPEDIPKEPVRESATESSAESRDQKAENKSEESADTNKKKPKKKNKKTVPPDADTGESEEKPKKTLSDKITVVFDKIEYTFDKMCAKIEMLSAKTELVTDFLSDGVHQSAFLKCFSELKKLLFRLRPKQCRGKIRFGFEDPSLTGKVLAGASMLYPYWGEHVYCCPDFEEKVLEGEVSVKGAFRILPAAVMGWNLLWSRNVRRTVLDARRLISKLKK